MIVSFIVLFHKAVQEFINKVNNETGLEDVSLLVRSFTRDPSIHLERIKVSMSLIHSLCVSMVTEPRLQDHICVVL